MNHGERSPAQSHQEKEHQEEAELAVLEEASMEPVHHRESLLVPTELQTEMFALAEQTFETVIGLSTCSVLEAWTLHHESVVRVSLLQEVSLA